MRTPKKAKCGIHSLSFCNTKHDAPQCEECMLVKHRDKKYIFKNGYKLKRCPHCGEYKRLDEFKKNSQGYLCWCYDCHKSYARDRHRIIKKTFMIGHKVNGIMSYTQVDNAVKMIKYIRQHMVNDNVSAVTIQRIK